jgi:hypothetical protein
MAKERQPQRERDPVRGAEMLRRVFPLLATLAESGTHRDKAGHRLLLFSQSAGLVLLGLFNPVLQSARALVATSGLRKVRQLTGGKLRCPSVPFPKRRRSSRRSCSKALSDSYDRKCITIVISGG